MTDPQLLEQLAANPAGPAMAEIARRHVDLVYSAALRQVRDAHLAEDVTQAVFLVLARKASRLGPDVKLSGWLYNTARLTAKNSLRAERRRRRHEGAAGRLTMEAAMDVSMNTPAGSTESPDAAWQTLAPHLDDAMAALNEHDRQLILWRYFESRSHQQTAAVLGVSENTANRRLLRAADKLRRILTGKGVMLSAAALTPLIAAHAVKAAPAGLKIATAGAASASAVGLSKGTLTMMLTAKLKIAVAIVVAILLAGSSAAVIVKVVESPIAPPATPAPVLAGGPASVVAPATSPALIDPGSGVTQVARYSLVIQPALADAVRKIATPLKADPQPFELFTVDSRNLLDLLARSIDTPAVMDVSDSVQFVLPSPPGQGRETRADAFRIDSRLTFAGRPVDLQATFFGKTTFLLGAPSITEKIEYSDVNAFLRQIRDPNAISHKTLNLAGTFAPPTSVIALGRVGLAPRQAWVLIVWQSIAATPPRMPMIVQWTTNAHRWIASRMNDVIAEADDGLAWSKLAATLPAGPQTEVALANPDCTVSVVSVRRMAVHPFRLWSAAGRPLQFDRATGGDQRISNNPGDLEIHFFAQELAQHRGAYDSYVYDNPDDHPFAITLGVAAGPWTTVGPFETDQPIHDGPVQFSVSDVSPSPDQKFSEVRIEQTGEADVQYVIEAVDSAGKAYRSMFDGAIEDYPKIVFNRPPDPRPSLRDYSFDPPPQKIDHFVLKKRPVRKVTLAHIAAVPDLSSNSGKVVRPAPATRPANLVAGSPEDVMNYLLDAVLANDSAKFRSLMAGAAADQAAIDAEFGMIAMQRQLCLAAVKQFGEDEIRRVVPDLDGDIEQQFGQLRQMKWTIQGDTATVAGGTNPLKFIRQNGAWKFSPPPPSAREVDHANARMAGFKQVLADLQAGKFKYVEELADAVHQAENPPVKP